MYYIRMVPRTHGSKRDRKARRSIENYNTLEAAIKAMHKFVHQQETPPHPLQHTVQKQA